MIEIRPGTEADRPQIVARMAEVFGDEPAARAERLWDWQWHRDPRLPTPGYRGIVAEWRGQIIGNLATIPAGLHMGGVPVTAYWCVDVLMHWGLMRQALRDHRRQMGVGPDFTHGIAAALLDHPSAGPIQLSKHIADPMMAIIGRIGFKAMPGTCSLQRRISLRHTLARGLGRPLGGMLGAVVDLGLPIGPRPGLPVEVLAGGFDGRFDRLWEEVRSRYSALCQRDARTLDWRYRQQPEGDYRVLTTGVGERLRGYLVLLTYKHRSRRRAKLVDLLTAPDDTEAIRALLCGGLHWLRDWRAEKVEAFACGNGIGTILGSMGFAPPLNKFGQPHPLMARGLPAAAEGIYVTQGDGDGG
ncbi:MAG: hypothetical protein WAT23_08855 [Chromatiaceae bacterium]